jgi:hypothetical protein
MTVRPLSCILYGPTEIEVGIEYSFDQNTWHRTSMLSSTSAHFGAPTGYNTSVFEHNLDDIDIGMIPASDRD